MILEDVLGLDGPEDARLRYQPALGSIPAGAVVLLLHPVDLTTILDRADRGGIMPPKSTYIVPKLRSGIFVAPC